MSLAERITDSARPTESGCWEWQRHTDLHGYGRVHFRGRFVMAHRAAYEILVGPIPGGLVLDHLCRNRRCINPAHLEPVTIRENNKRCACVSTVAAQVETCPAGHPYDDKNTYRGNGRRRCRACGREKQKRRYYRRKARQAGGDQSCA